MISYRIYNPGASKEDLNWPTGKHVSKLRLLKVEYKFWKNVLQSEKQANLDDTVPWITIKFRAASLTTKAAGEIEVV